MLTQRIHPLEKMSSDEVTAFRQIIRRSPWLYAPALRRISELSYRVQTLLDVCAGDGYFIDLVEQICPGIATTGIDIDCTMVSNHSRVCIGDAMYLSQKADVLTCVNALHHMQKPLEFLEILKQQSHEAVIVLDQVRPHTHLDLERRLELRKRIVIRDEPYYRKCERESILEAYGYDELLSIAKESGYKLEFFDEDYYQRAMLTYVHQQE